MKKSLLFIVVLVVALFSASLAEDFGVQIIGGEGSDFEVLNLDDMKLETVYEIGGYARITPQTFGYIDVFPIYDAGSAGDNSLLEYNYKQTVADGIAYNANINDRSKVNQRYAHIKWQSSGANADYVWFVVDVTNLQKEAFSVVNNATVKVVLNDDYEFGGWILQLNYDYDTMRDQRLEQREDNYGFLIRAAIHAADEEPINMMYTGHYVFGCTLPNAAIEGSEPLKIVINLGDNELTYNIRK